MFSSDFRGHGKVLKIKLILTAQFKNTYVALLGDSGLIPGLGRSPGEGHSNPLQYSCLGNSMDREAWWATIYGVTKSWTQQQLSTQASYIIQGFLFIF